MKIALLRVGVDSACGRTDAPLLKNGCFEFIPIPDISGRDLRTYGTVYGRHGLPLISYFPDKRQEAMRKCSIHFDPEFETFTYGDGTRPKRGLRRLQKGDLLIFYAGLKGWGFSRAPALYIVGYFKVIKAGFSHDFTIQELKREFGKNWHVKNERNVRSLLRPGANVVLVKGGRGSRLLKRAVCISETAQNSKGKPLKVLSKRMRKHFGDFNGKVSIQRSPPRWITDERWVTKTLKFLKTLR